MPTWHKNWRDVVRRAMDAGVDRLVLTGSNVASSQACLDMAETWFQETHCQNLFVTVGVHPCHVQEFDETTTIPAMKQLLQHPLAVAVGECGLDYSSHGRRHRSEKNGSSSGSQEQQQEQQKLAFREQVILAYLLCGSSSSSSIRYIALTCFRKEVLSNNR
ncbi:hypothetical protein ACA910_006531 [Epithemia clementina (nom. ined.)]